MFIVHPPDIIDRFLSPEVCLGEVDAASLASAPKVETEQEKQLRIAHENKPRLDEMYNAFDFECKSHFFYFFWQEKKRKKEERDIDIDIDIEIKSIWYTCVSGFSAVLQKKSHRMI